MEYSGAPRLIADRLGAHLSVRPFIFGRMTNKEENTHENRH